jgi:chromosome partitioning protein
MVREARRQRREFDGRLTDWIVVRNRLSALGSRNKRLVGEGLSELASRMGFRWVDGFSERVIYREFFPRGLAALDDLDQATLGKRPNKSHVTARDEVIALLNALASAAVRERQAASSRPRGMVFNQGPAAASP